MSTLDIPVDIEASVISSTLNSGVLFVFIMGMYTVIYAGTIYVYFRKNPSKYHPVPVAITTLYLSSMTQTAVQWYITKWNFIDNGDTRQSVFFDALEGPQWQYIVPNIFSCITFAIADGLLIWRCFYVWNRSLRVISVSLLLLIAEITLYLVEIAFDAKYSAPNISVAVAIIADQVLAAAFFMSFSSTLVTTLLIAYRIYSVSKHQGPSSARFKHIADTVVQSGAVYALSQLMAAISDVVPGENDANNTRNFAFIVYTQALNSAIAGILPTIMVARVALLAADTTYPSTSLHLSRLQFPECSGSVHPTAHMEGAHFVAGNANSDSEEQGNEHQAQ